MTLHIGRGFLIAIIALLVGVAIGILASHFYRANQTYTKADCARDGGAWINGACVVL